jgi:DNA replication and repair protein RecF
MYVAHLSLTDFRSYEQVELPLEAGITALIGPNGQGKTNLVEAIGYSATFSSHRVPTDAALVRSGADRAVVRTTVVRGTRPTLIEIEINPGRANRARLNRSPVPRARDVVGIVRTVLFAPEDLGLVKGDPDGRRRFLDELVVLLRPRMAGVIQDYERVLRQRSALLKTAAAAARGSRGSADLRTLDVWDAKLAQTGAQIVAGRLALVAGLTPHVAAAYSEVSAGQGDAVITYRSSIDATPADAPPTEPSPAPRVELIEAQLLEAIARLRPKEIARGVSLVGPHRDDLVLELAGLPAKGYASHGESWSLALALRLASYRLLTAGESDLAGSPASQHAPAGGPGAEHNPGAGASDWGEDGEPVLILDDVFAELDVRRRDRLAALVAPARQVIVTAAVAQDVPEQLNGARIDVMDGQAHRVL